MFFPVRVLVLSPACDWVHRPGPRQHTMNAFCSCSPPRALLFRLGSGNQVDSFLNEERASIDEYDQYLTGRSALADRTQAVNASAEKAGARNRGSDSAPA